MKKCLVMMHNLACRTTGSRCGAPGKPLIGREFETDSRAVAHYYGELSANLSAFPAYSSVPVDFGEVAHLSSRLLLQVFQDKPWDMVDKLRNDLVLQAGFFTYPHVAVTEKPEVTIATMRQWGIERL